MLLEKVDCLLCRWREAVCVMMIYSEPGMTPENLTNLGRQLGKLFKQVSITES